MTKATPALGLEPQRTARRRPRSSSDRGCRWARRPGSAAGRPTSARASATRCCSPPDSSPGPVADAVGEADLAEGVRGQLARLRRPAGAGCRAGSMAFSSAEHLAEQVVELEDEAHLVPPEPRQLRAPDRAKRSWPRKSTRPAVGRSSAPRTCSSVDLPTPEAPTTATSSAAWTVRFTPLRTRSGSGPARYSFSTLLGDEQRSADRRPPPGRPAARLTHSGAPRPGAGAPARRAGRASPGTRGPASAPTIRTKSGAVQLHRQVADLVDVAGEPDDRGSGSGTQISAARGRCPRPCPPRRSACPPPGRRA